MISCIVPVYNKEKALPRTLRNLTRLDGIEIIVVDGNSEDRTLSIAHDFPVRVVKSIRTRSRQMNDGAAVASGDALLFLHADCVISQACIAAIKATLARGYIGGCFTQRIESQRHIYRFIEFSGNVRARLSGVFYGDQAIFVDRHAFQKLGGFDIVHLFDDVLFSRKMSTSGRTRVLRQEVLVSPRRWERQGFLKTALIYWTVMLGFACGASTDKLRDIYQVVR